MLMPRGFQVLEVSSCREPDGPDACAKITLGDPDLSCPTVT